MKETVVPQQVLGSRLDAIYTVTCSCREAAMDRFRTAIVRLLCVGEWHELCGPLSAHFEVTTSAGSAVNQFAEEGGYFRISIPGPGPIEGDGYDWVKIERIEDSDDPTQDESQVSMRVRPSSNPTSSNGDVAHFFGGEATSTFRVTRTGRKVSASVHGRNEKANDDTATVVDNVRNTLVSLGARAGVSSLQWNRLVKGIIEGPPDE